MAGGFCRAAGVAVICFGFAFAAFAQTQRPGSRFDITGYVVEGSPLLNSEVFSRIVSPFIGKQKSAADVQKAQQTLQQAYFDIGHCSVHVTVPRASPDAGVITFRLVQAPAPLSKDCLPMVVLDEKRATPPVTARPGEVAVRPFADVSGTVPETTAPAESRREIARAPVKPLQDSPRIKPLQDRPVGVAAAPKPAIAAAPVTREEPAPDVTVKPLAEVPSPQPGLVASTDFSAPPPAAKPAAPVPIAPPAAVAVAPSVPQLKPEIALAPALPPAPKPEAPPAIIAVTPPAAPAPKVEAAPVPASVVSEPVTPAVVKPEPAPIASAPVVAPVTVAPSPAPKVEAPVAVASTPPARAEELKPAETLAAPVIAAPERPGIIKPDVVPPALVAVAPPAAPPPKVEAAPVPAPVVSEPVTPAVVKPELASIASAPVVAPVTVAPSPAPKVEAPVAVASTPPAAAEELKPAETLAAPVIAVPAARPETVPLVAQVEPARSAAAVEMPKIAAVEEKPVPPSEPKPVAEPVKEQIIAEPEPAAPETVALAPVPEVIAPLAEHPAEKPAPAVVAATPTTPEPVKPQPASVPVVPAPEPASVAVAPTPAPPPVVGPAPKPETVSPIAASPAQPTPPVEAPKIAVIEENPVTPSAPNPAVAEAPVKEQMAAQPESQPAPRPAREILPPVPAITAQPKPESAPVVAAAPESAPKPKAPPATIPGAGSALGAPAEIIVRPFTDAAATPAEAPEPAETKPEITRAPIRLLQDRTQAPTPVTEKPAIATASVPAVASKPEAAAAAKPAAAKPEPASTPRIAEAAPIREAPAEKKPGPKPAPVVVHAPAGSARSAILGVSPDTTKPADSNAVAAPLKFFVERFMVEGNTVLKPETISRVLIGYTGAQKDFADVQRALEALQIAYQDAGYGAVQVTLPEQELDDGEVELNVIETRLGKIDVQGNDYHNEQNIRNSLPVFKEGTTPNSLAIARSLRVANENSSKQTQVALRAGSQDGEVDATVKVVDDSPIKRSISLDNTGTYATGKYRAGFGYQHANMFNRDHTLTLQYITSPEHPSAVTVLGLGYRVPLYKLGHSIDLIAGYSDVQSGTVQQLFNISGAGTVFGARYNQNLNRSENYEHKITYGIDYRAFKNNVTFVGSFQPLVPDITVHPVSIAYSGLWRAADSQFDFYGSYAQNIFPGGNDGANSDFQGPSAGFPNGSRVGAKAGYNVIRAGANYTRQIWGEWQARAVFATQYTDNALIAGEQFGVGGADNVRGFDERAFSNDRGYRTTVELYTPDMASNIGWSGGRIKFLAFYDAANLTRNFRQPSEQDGLSIDSYGLGLRLQTKNYLTVRADYAQVAHDGGLTAGILSGRRNSNTLHASMVLVF